MSALSLLHSVKDFSIASAKAAKLLSKGAATQDEINAALASHPANPLNVTPAAVVPAAVAPAVVIPAASAVATHPKNPENATAIANGYASKEQVLNALRYGTIDVATASVYLSRFESNRPTHVSPDLPRVINVEALKGFPKTFSTGNTGFFVGGKMLIDGVRYQVTLNVVKIKG